MINGEPGLPHGRRPGASESNTYPSSAHGARDRVCVMSVGDDAAFRAEHVFGRTERSCSERRMGAFLPWPLVFTRHSDREDDHDRLERADAW